jgi:hypothetical protein
MRAPLKPWAKKITTNKVNNKNKVKKNKKGAEGEE